jgi:hypothetical protein
VFVTNAFAPVDAQADAAIDHLLASFIHALAGYGH